MPFPTRLAATPFAHTVLALATAFLLGAAIGLERRARPAGRGAGPRGLPGAGVETLSESDAPVELAAVLAPSSAEAAELDAVVTALEAEVAVLSATWGVETTA